MTAFRTGVHTIEFQTTNYLRLSDLPEKYADAIKPEGKKRYRLNVAKIRGAAEYSHPAETQKVMEEAFTTFADMGAGYCKTTRVDFRFDDHERTYADNLPLMTVLVNLIAHESGIYDRRVFYADGNGIITSVRCMPDKEDHDTLYGVEYYDKPKQAKTDEYGNARLELRRVNMSGETVPFIVKEWRLLLARITEKKYHAMLEDHAAALYSTKQDGETPTQFMRRMRYMMIAREEEGKLFRISGKTPNHYYGGNLPDWKQVKAFVDSLSMQLDTALIQPKTGAFITKRCADDLPF